MVAEIVSERLGLQRVTVRRDVAEPEPAYVLTQLTGKIKVCRKTAFQKFSNRSNCFNSVKGFERFLEIEVLNVQAEGKFRML